MQINLSKTAIQNVLALINDANALALTTAEVSLGIPAEFDGGVENDRNTQVEVSAVPGSGYVDSVNVRYYRLDLDVLKGVRVLSHTKNESSTLASVTEAIAIQLGVIEDQIQLTDEAGDVLTELPVLGGQSRDLLIQAKEDAYCYIGSTVFTLNPVPSTDTPVEDDIQQRDLNGFEYPEDQTPPAEEGGEEEPQG